jgi:hypothetical protein
MRRSTVGLPVLIVFPGQIIKLFNEKLTNVASGWVGIPYFNIIIFMSKFPITQHFEIFIDYRDVRKVL